MNRSWRMALAMTMVIGLVLVTTVSAESMNVIQNGSFEGEFVNGVGKGWTAFNNSGEAIYSYGDETTGQFIYDGAHAQLLVLDTGAYGGTQPDRYTGVYQTANVVPGAQYMFSLYGLVRSSEGTEQQSSYNYRVEVGFDQAGGTDPRAVTDWVEMDKWKEYPLDKPGAYQSYAHGVTATSNKLTVFIRIHKKFATPQEQARINLDAVSLVGPSAGTTTTVAPTASSATIPQTGAGDLLPLVGLALAATAISLTGLRLRRQRR